MMIIEEKTQMLWKDGLTGILGQTRPSIVITSFKPTAVESFGTAITLMLKMTNSQPASLTGLKTVITMTIVNTKNLTL